MTMINHFISRVILVINISILTNTILIDGLVSNLIQTSTLIGYNCGHLETRYKFHALISLCSMLMSIYLLYCLCFNKFLLIVHTDHTERSSGCLFVIFFIIPFIFWCILVAYLCILLASKNLYAPTQDLYHKAPPGYSKADSDELNSMKNMIKSKFSSLLKIAKNKEDEWIDTDLEIKKLPWFLLNLTRSQSLELQLKYAKFCLFTCLNIFFFLLFFIRLNLFAKLCWARSTIYINIFISKIYIQKDNINNKRFWNLINSNWLEFGLY